jgi:fructosamine-3-kinase
MISSMPATNRLPEQGASLLGGVLVHAETLSGGNLSHILAITLEDGRKAIVKSGPAPQIEAAMLRAMAAGGAPAPAVLAVSGVALAIEMLPAGGSLRNAWADLGRILAMLHANHGQRYGWADDYAFGLVAIANGWAGDWPRFWAERRLLCHVPHIPGAMARRLEALAADLPNRLPARPAAALLHGDLWTGNVLVDGGRVSGLIDPACYYGHAEVDFTMLSLFDAPPASFYDAYGPREPGHADRLPVYQLWPALVHLRLFGSGYRGLVERLLSAAGV